MLFITGEDQLAWDKSDRVICYFYTPWIHFHKQVVQSITDIEDKFTSATFYAIDVLQFDKLVKRLQPKTLPTIQVRDTSGALLGSVSGVSTIVTGLEEELADIVYAEVQSSNKVTHDQENS